MKKRKLSTTLACLISLVSVSFVTFTVSATVAAFMVLERHNQTINVNMEYGRYFAANSGNYDEATGKTTYYIENGDQLNNLAYLVNLGVFNNNDVFKLSKSFNYKQNQNIKPLTPIGTIHNPFCSTFDGQGYYIDNLEVVGTDLSDVGMFGYVSEDGAITNFGLNSPIVKQVRTTAGEFLYGTKDNNPLRNSITIDMCQGFTLTGITNVNGTDNAGNSKVIGYSKFKINNDVALPDTFYINCSVSNPNLLSVTYDASLTNPEFTFTVNNYTKEQVNYATIEFYVTGIASINGENRFVKYVMEKYKVFCDINDDNNRYVIADKDDPKVLKKIIFSEVDMLDSPGGNVAYDHVEHTLNLGIVAGTCESRASQILVYNPSLISQGGPFSSNSYLIGKYIDDDNKSPVSQYDINLDALPNSPTYKFATKAKSDLGNSTSPDGTTFYDNSDSDSGSVLITNVYGDKQSGLFHRADNDVMRVYGTSSGYNVNIDYKTPYEYEQDSNPNRFDSFIDAFKDGRSVPTDQGVKFSQYDIQNEVDENNQPIKNKVLTFTKDAKGHIRFQRKSFIGLIAGQYNKIHVDNAISFWASGKDNADLIQKIINRAKGSFYLSIDFDYLYFDNDYDNIAANQTSNKKIKVLAANKCLDSVTSGSKAVFNSPTWYANYTNPADGAFAPVKSWFPIDEVSSPDNIIPADTIAYPSGQVQANQDGTDPLFFKKDEIHGKVSDINPNTYYEPKHKTVIIQSQVGKGEGLFNSNYYSPLYLFGMDSSNSIDNPGTANINEKDYEFSIIRMVVTISSIAGNSAATVLNVDFTDTKSKTIPTPENFEHSRIKISTSMFDRSGIIPSGQTAPGLSVATEAQGGNGTYRIDVRKTRNGADVDYWCPTGINQNEKLRPISVPGFTLVSPTYKGEI